MRPARHCSTASAQAPRRDMAGALGSVGTADLAAVQQALAVLHRVFANDRVPEVGATL